MKFKIKQTWPSGYSGAAYKFSCPLCTFYTPRNMDPNFVKASAMDHLLERHDVAFAKVDFVIKRKGELKPKTPVERLVFVRHRSPHGNMLTSVVEPHSGQDPLSFAQWAAKEFPTDEYSVMSYKHVSTEIIPKK